MSEASGSYTWSGSLQSTNIRALYERCQKLRLTGRMVLSQGESSLEIIWIAGEPIENEGDQGTRSLPLWNQGDFLVEQRMPDFKGQLTKGIEMSGALKPGLCQALYKLCSDNALSADVEIKRSSGETAQVRFATGKAETATIAGQNESALSAISKLGSWVDGSYRVVLRPKFDEASTQVPAEASKKRRDSSDKFDLTGSVSIDVSKGGPAEWPPKLKPGDSLGGAVPKPTPAAPAPAGGDKKPGAPTPASAGKRISADNLALMAPSALPTQPLSVLARSQIAKEATKKPSGGSKAVVVISVLVIVLCAAAIAGILVLR